MSQEVHRNHARSQKKWYFINDTFNLIGIGILSYSLVLDLFSLRVLLITRVGTSEALLLWYYTYFGKFKVWQKKTFFKLCSTCTEQLWPGPTLDLVKSMELNHRVPTWPWLSVTCGVYKIHLNTAQKGTTPLKVDRVTLKLYVMWYIALHILLYNLFLHILTPHLPWQTQY